jgi:sulfide:quinone oxidoreductase
MHLKPLSASLSVSPQIAPSDVAAIAAAGFKSVICNRPDGESADQPLYAEVEKAASAAGLRARYVPVVSGKVSDADAAAFKVAIEVLPKPILAYCKSGTRSATLWAFSESGRLSPNEIVDNARAAGFDVSAVISRVAAGGSA